MDLVPIKGGIVSRVSSAATWVYILLCQNFKEEGDQKAWVSSGKLKSTKERGNGNGSGGEVVAEVGNIEAQFTAVEVPIGCGVSRQEQ